MNIRKNREIECLRGVAVLMTCLAHLAALLPDNKSDITRLFSLFFPSGGVDLFFCISGYVVSKSFVETLDSHRQKGGFWVAAQAFWIRRAYRLIPTSWFWVLVGMSLSILFNSTGVFGNLHANIVSATAIITFVGNYANEYGTLLGPNIIYWSLALEEQFYIMFPFFLWLTPQRWRITVLIILIGLQFPLPRNNFGTPLSSMLWAFRLDSVMWGVLIYFFTRSGQYNLFKPIFLTGSRFKAIGLTLLLIYLLGAIPAQLIAIPTAYGLVAIVSALLVLLASYECNYIGYVPVLTKVLEWIGSRSYAIYIIHVLVYRVCFEAWTRYTAAHGQALDGTYALRLFVSATVLMVVLAELNFRIIELPLRKVGADIASRRLAQWKAP